MDLQAFVRVFSLGVRMLLHVESCPHRGSGGILLSKFEAGPIG